MTVRKKYAMILGISICVLLTIIGITFFVKRDNIEEQLSVPNRLEEVGGIAVPGESNRIENDSGVLVNVTTP